MFQFKKTISKVDREGEYNDSTIYMVTFDDGEQRKLFTKSVPPAIGSVLEYNVTAKGNISLAQPREGGFGGGKSFGGGYKKDPAKDALIVRQVALKSAVEFAAVHALKTDQVLQVAEKFNTWIMAETKKAEENAVSSPQQHFGGTPAASTPAPVAQVPTGTSAATSNATNDDLPF